MCFGWLDRRISITVLLIRGSEVNLSKRSKRSNLWHSYLVIFLGEPDVECLNVVCLTGLSLLFELLILFIQGLQLVFHRGCAKETVELAHSQDVILTCCRFGIA